ncbi:hypothetical protein R1flu_018269 [Riccia fluitans]|uniref:Uncharacterized protein n=1 Tax=Riccia fluitans TaxID=41844 RepID=A0ABD1ZGS7_9MARC
MQEQLRVRGLAKETKTDRERERLGESKIYSEGAKNRGDESYCIRRGQREADMVRIPWQRATCATSAIVNEEEANCNGEQTWRPYRRGFAPFDHGLKPTEKKQLARVESAKAEDLRNAGCVREILSSTGRHCLIRLSRSLAFVPHATVTKSNDTYPCRQRPKTQSIPARTPWSLKFHQFFTLVFQNFIFINCPTHLGNG